MSKIEGSNEPMNDNHFANLISNAVAQRMTPEFVEQQVLVRTDELIKGAVDEALRRYSKTGKIITEAIENALKVDRLDLPSYGETVAVIVERLIKEHVSDLVSGRLAKDMEDLLNLAPKEVKLSEMADEMRLSHEQEGGYGEVITVIVERRDSGYAMVYLDETRGEVEKHACDVRLHLCPEGKIISAQLDGGSQDLKSTRYVGRHYGINQRVLAYYACGTRITLDEDDVVVSVGDY